MGYACILLHLGSIRDIQHAVRHARCVKACLLVIDTFLHFARLTGEQENASGAV